MTKVNRNKHAQHQVTISPNPDTQPTKVEDIAVEQFEKMKTQEKGEPSLEEHTFRLIPALSNIALFAAAVFVTKWMIKC